MSCLPGPCDSLNIITTEDKSAVVAWCCFKRLSASPLKKRILFRKKKLFTLIHLVISVMIDSSAVNKTMENASAFTRRFPSKAEGIALCSALILSLVLIIAGTLLTLVPFAVTKPLRRKILFLVLSMAFADLMLGAFTLPFYIFFVGGDYQLWTVKYDSEHMAYQIFYTSLDYNFLFSSYISAASISCERCYAVFWPFKHRSLSTRTYRVIIFVIWTLAVLVSTLINLLNFYDSSSFESILYVFNPVALGLTTIICVCNIAIWRNFQQESVVSHNRNGASRNRSLTKTLLLLSILALVCWLPLIIMDVLIFTYVSETSLLCIYVIANILNYSNSFVNPIVYVFRIPEFQQALRSCYTKRRPAIIMVKTERRNRKVAPITPETQLRILRNDPSHLQVEVEQEGIRKLSFSQLR